VKAREDVEWVVAGILARGRRPGYFRGQSVSKAEVDAWIDNVNTFGVKSIICLLAEDQLPYYDALTFDLISYYRRRVRCDACRRPGPSDTAAFVRSADRNLAGISGPAEAGAGSLQCRHRSNWQCCRVPSAAIAREH
jgi:hypothetical protein